MISRRQFLQFLGALGVAPWAANRTHAAEPLPWHNWSGYLKSTPARRHTVKTESELSDILRAATGTVRPVGAGHSFSPLVPTDDDLLVIDDMQGLVAHDAIDKTAVLRAGTRLSVAGELLQGIDQAMFNLPDIDRQTLAGAVATSTHGTGLALGSLSAYVNYVRLVKPDGEVVEIDANQNAAWLPAAQVNLGALGVVTALGFQNRGKFNVRSQTWVEKTSEVMASFKEKVRQYEHYEFLPFVHCDYSLVIAHKEVSEAAGPIEPEEDAGPIFDTLAKVPIMLRKPLFNTMVQDLPPTDKIEPSHLALTNLRFDRFNEMEYSVPVDVGLECLAEVLHTIEAEGIDVVFPLEYREIAGDDTWLSMFAGGARASISIHRKAGEDYHPYFDRIEPIFWKYGGRPHWGKVHSLGYKELAELYPRFDDFVALQREFDPNGKMLNKHLRKLFNRSV
jgi:FAD-linked oxidoreductase